MQKEMILFTDCLKENLKKGIEKGYYREDQI